MLSETSQPLDNKKPQLLSTEPVETRKLKPTKKALRTWRKAVLEMLHVCDVKQTCVADAVGMYRSNLNQCLHGGRNPSLETILSINQAIGDLSAPLVTEYLRLVLIAEMPEAFTISAFDLRLFDSHIAGVVARWGPDDDPHQMFYKQLFKLDMATVQKIIFDFVVLSRDHLIWMFGDKPRPKPFREAARKLLLKYGLDFSGTLLEPSRDEIDFFAAGDAVQETVRKILISTPLDSASRVRFEGDMLQATYSLAETIDAPLRNELARKNEAMSRLTDHSLALHSIINDAKALLDEAPSQPSKQNDNLLARARARFADIDAELQSYRDWLLAHSEGPTIKMLADNWKLLDD
jgi:hypothetical protein